MQSSVGVSVNGVWQTFIVQRLWNSTAPCDETNPGPCGILVTLRHTGHFSLSMRCRDVIYQCRRCVDVEPCPQTGPHRSLHLNRVSLFTGRLCMCSPIWPYIIRLCTHHTDQMPLTITPLIHVVSVPTLLVGIQRLKRSPFEEKFCFFKHQYWLTCCIQVSSFARSQPG